MICIVITIFALFDRKDTNAVPITTNKHLQVHFLIDKAIGAHNEMKDFQKNNTSTLINDQRNVTIAKNYDKLETHQKPKTIRQVPSDIPVASVFTSMDNINVGHYYSSPLMVYPFSMMNSYYPKYFPYTYNYPGYQSNGYPFIG